SHNNTTITIRAYLENSMLLVEIEDQGIGMKHDDIKIAFTKYGTVRREHMKFIDSYGLGLPIVKLLLDAHNASIDVTSELNVGTKVKISFPKYKLVYGKNNAESQNTDLNTKQLKRYG
ncbi:MAG: Sensor histidine kinase YycG, partial [Pseudomonadota bacterium]